MRAWATPGSPTELLATPAWARAGLQLNQRHLDAANKRRRATAAAKPTQLTAGEAWAPTLPSLAEGREPSQMGPRLGRWQIRMTDIFPQKRSKARPRRRLRQEAAAAEEVATFEAPLGTEPPIVCVGKGLAGDVLSCPCYGPSWRGGPYGPLCLKVDTRLSAMD
jgi:hypothetical protein